MAAHTSVSKDTSPSVCLEELQRLGAFLAQCGVRVHPLDAEPVGVVNAAIGAFQVRQGCYREMGRLADYLQAHGWYDTSQYSLELTVDTVIRALEQCREAHS